MGKAKKSKQNSKSKPQGQSQAHPLRRNRPVAPSPLDDSAKTTVSTLISKLQSPKPEDRSMAIAAINPLIENPQMRQLFLKERLVPTVLKQNVTDSNLEVSAEAIGLLRNVTIEEGYDIAIYLYRQDVLTPLGAGISTWKAKLGGGYSGLGTNGPVLLSLFENIVGLITALAMIDNGVFEAVEKSIPALPQFLVGSIDIARGGGSAGTPLFETIAQALYFFSQENRQFISKLPDYDFDALIEDAGVSQLVKVYILGLKYNSYVENSGTEGDDRDSSFLAQILRQLVGVLSQVDFDDAENTLETAGAVTNDDPVDVKALTVKISRAQATIDAIQVAFELFAAISETVSVDLQLEATDGEDDDQIVIDPEHQPDEKSPSEPKNSLASRTLLSSVVPLVSKYVSKSTLTSRALAALNNACWAIPAAISEEDQEWKSTAQELWINLLPYASLGSHSVEVANGAIGTLWAISKAYSGQVPIELAAVDGLISQATNVSGSDSSGDDGHKTELITRTIGLLGPIGSVEGNLELTTKVAEFLLSFVTRPLEVPPQALFESLNAIYDLFGDSTYAYDQQLFVQRGLLDVLSNSVGSVRQVIRKVDKNKNPQLREVGEEVGINLNRFIEYKRKEQSGTA